MLLLISLCFLAMVLFCLAMPKHRQQVIAFSLPQQLIYCFRPLAWLVMVLSAYISVTLFGYSIGPALLFGALTVAVLLLILLLSYQAKVVLPLAITIATVLAITA